MSKAIKMLLIDPERGFMDASSSMLAELLQPTDLLVVNDAATLPASLAARTLEGHPLEIRLVDAPYARSTRAVLLGAGDYHTKTEDRPEPPALKVGQPLVVSDSLVLYLASVSNLSPRLVELAWSSADAEERFRLLYAHGRPVQYSYVDAPLALWDVQTSFAMRPWAVEMPSAARPLNGEVLSLLRRRGVRIATLTHAAGLSATGDEALDAALPLAEPYEIPASTAHAVVDAMRRGERVVAVGTSVVRALEDGAQKHGTVRAGRELATLVLSARHRPCVVSGLLTGVHMPGESHYRLLEAFVSQGLLAEAARHAQLSGYRPHELGDACLVLPGLLGDRRHDAGAPGHVGWRRDIASEQQRTQAFTGTRVEASLLVPGGRVSEGPEHDVPERKVRVVAAV
jgi:S-adenosylmethionine:tRNA ribosyltransferase-isomerase